MRESPVHKHKLRIGSIKKRKERIDWWKSHMLELDLENLRRGEYTYARLRLDPWSRSKYAYLTYEPHGEVRRYMVEALLDIYDHWKKQLESFDNSYYLKIWLYDNRFTESEVVCAIGERIERYENIFYFPDENKEFNTDDYGTLADRLNQFEWELAMDEDIYFENDVDDYESSSDVVWFKRMVKGPHRLARATDGQDVYCLKKGYVWVGEKK
jgi:hypothetical protein